MNRALVALAGLATIFVLTFSVSRGSAQEAEANYVGDSVCKKCHFKQHRYWKKTGLAKAMDSLKPTAEADDKDLFAAKKAAKLDPAKDYSTDASCLACHTTGYGKPGGYPVNPAASDEAKAAAESMGKISCEACHGAGSLYVEHKNKALEADKEAKFTFDGLSKVGLSQPDEANCKTCHNDQNPANATSTFKFDDAKGAVHSKKKKK